MDRAFHNNAMPVTDHLGGGENIRSKDYLAIYNSPERRRAQIIIIADHVPDDPVQINLGARGIGGHDAIAQHHGVVTDLQGLFKVMRDINDRHPFCGEVADHFEKQFHLSGGKRGGRLIHDEDAAVDGKRAGDFDDLLLTETQLLDRCERIDVLLEFVHESPRLAPLLREIHAGRGSDLATYENVVAHVHIGREA